MKLSVSDVARHAAVAAVSALVLAEPAFAGIAPVPGPLIGVGAPALAVFAAGYWLIRKRRER